MKVHADKSGRSRAEAERHSGLCVQHRHGQHSVTHLSHRDIGRSRHWMGVTFGIGIRLWMQTAGH
jgi:hypothetical protein